MYLKSEWANLFSYDSFEGKFSCERNNFGEFFHGGFMSLFQKCTNFREADFFRRIGLYPFFKRVYDSEGTTVQIEDKEVIMIGSNNYLGLTHDPRVKEAAIEAIKKYGTGCTGSRFLNGNLHLITELEEKLCEFLGMKAALVYSTGFFANQGTLSVIAEEGEYFISDAENHASIIEGIKLSKAKKIIFKHNDPEDLEKKLQALPSKKNKLVIIDGVYSMRGNIAKLPKIVEMVKKYNAYLYVDDAHSIGVLGKGKGTGHHFGLEDSIDLVMGTFSKSLASIGGFIAARDNLIIDFIKHNSRPMIFSASMAPASAATVLKTLEIIKSEPERIDQLWAVRKKMATALESLGLNLMDSETPIIPIYVGSEIKAFSMVAELFERGIYATPVMYPAVDLGKALIRTSYMATHTEAQLNHVLEVISDIKDKYNLTNANQENPEPNGVMDALTYLDGVLPPSKFEHLKTEIYNMA